MADGTKIEWTDATWNPITGCAVVSPGCTNCYAMKLAGTRLRHIPSRAGLTRGTKTGPVWTGEIRFNAEWLDQPLRWKRPRLIFVAAHGDLFAEGVTDEMLDQVFAVMALAPQHAFQVLTKRPERMREYLTRAGAETAIMRASRERLRTICDGTEPPRDAFARQLAADGIPFYQWPLPNVWLGVSVEDQTRANERVPILLDTPAAIRWVSAEPLLGPIDFRDIKPVDRYEVDALTGYDFDQGGVRNRLDWIVVGGESGYGARRMHPDWARSIRDQCADATVPFLFKQWGDYLPAGQTDALGWFWPGQHADGSLAFVRYGKKRSGRLLDHRSHDGYPDNRGEVPF